MKEREWNEEETARLVELTGLYQGITPKTFAMMTMDLNDHIAKLVEALETIQTVADKSTNENSMMNRANAIDLIKKIIKDVLDKAREATGNG